MDTLGNAILGLVFLGLSIASTFLMFKLWGCPFIIWGGGSKFQWCNGRTSWQLHRYSLVFGFERRGIDARHSCSTFFYSPE